MRSVSLQHTSGVDTASRQLRTSLRSSRDAIDRISSGLRMDSAADDAGGFGVAESMRARVASQRRALDNTKQAMEMMQIADDAHQGLADVLTRMHELAVQASSDGLNNADRAHLQTEMTTLVDEMDRLSDVTEYNGQKLTSAGGNSYTFQVGLSNTAAHQFTVALPGLSASDVGVGGLDVSNLTNAQSAIDTLASARDTLNNARATHGAQMNRLARGEDILLGQDVNLQSSYGTLNDTDVAAEGARLAAENFRQQASLGSMAQAQSVWQNMALRLLS